MGVVVGVPDSCAPDRHLIITTYSQTLLYRTSEISHFLSDITRLPEERELHKQANK
jgi:hypothetical protein